jgi:hypothetical protein
MELEYLKLRELRGINGGTKSDYGFGHAVGDHIRHGVQTFGDIVSWAFGLING